MREEVRNLLLARSATSCFVGNGTLEKRGSSGIPLKRIADIENMIGGRGQWTAEKKDSKGTRQKQLWLIVVCFRVLRYVCAAPEVPWSYISGAAGEAETFLSRGVVSL